MAHVAFIGPARMGSGMAARLLGAGARRGAGDRNESAVIDVARGAAPGDPAAP
ncbi:MAG: hypothetical protein IT200_00770 [Thermoleophilia bacterium]|nr:hypothetical protein [Thermoleophilia bacterium]